MERSLDRGKVLKCKLKNYCLDYDGAAGRVKSSNYLFFLGFILDLCWIPWYETCLYQYYYLCLICFYVQIICKHREPLAARESRIINHVSIKLYGFCFQSTTLCILTIWLQWLLWLVSVWELCSWFFLGNSYYADDGKSSFQMLLATFGIKITNFCTLLYLLLSEFYDFSCDLQIKCENWYMQKWR